MIDLGAVHQVAVDVRDAANALTNPATATLTITLPDGTTATPTVPAPAETGKLRVDYVTVQAGRHTWRMVTTGPVTSYGDTFDVVDAPVGVVSLADAKAQLNLPAVDASEDAELRGFIAAATGAIEEYKHELAYRRQVTEDIQVTTSGSFRLWRAPVASLVSVESADGSQTWDVANLRVSPSGVVRVVSGPAVAGLVSAVYVAGPAVVPAHYRLAALIIVQHLWETQRGRFGPVPGGGDDDRVRGLGFALPRRALELLGVPNPVVA